MTALGQRVLRSPNWSGSAIALTRSVRARPSQAYAQAGYGVPFVFRVTADALTIRIPASCKLSFSYATQMPGIATFWNRCGVAAADDG